jgi:tol-pal system protein YbgF
MENTIATAERADEDNTSPVSSAVSKRSTDSPVASKTETIVANVDKNKDEPRTEPAQAPDLATTGTAKTRLAAIELESDDLQVRATTSRKILREETTPAETVKKVIKGLDEDEESGLADTGAATIQKQFTRKNFDANKHVKPMQGNFIVIKPTDIYTSPQWHASRFRSLASGRKVEVNGYVQGGKWFRIKYAGGDGYVPVRRLREIRDETTGEPASAEISAETLKRKINVLPEGTSEQHYKFAMNMFQLGEYTTATQAFSEFVELHPHDSKAPSAIYWQGMSYYVKQNYSQAASSFMLLYKSFPRDNKAAEGLLKLSNSLHALGKQEAACTALEQLRNEYPGSYLRLKREIYNSGADAGCS